MKVTISILLTYLLIIIYGFCMGWSAHAEKFEKSCKKYFEDYAITQCWLEGFTEHESYVGIECFNKEKQH